MNSDPTDHLLHTGYVDWARATMTWYGWKLRLHLDGVRAGTVEVENHLNLLQLGQLLLCQRCCGPLQPHGVTGSPDQRAELPGCVAVFGKKKKKIERYEFQCERLPSRGKPQETSWTVCYTPSTCFFDFTQVYCRNDHMGYISIRKLNMNHKYNQYALVISKCDITTQSALYTWLAVHAYIISHSTKFLGVAARAWSSIGLWIEGGIREGEW